MAVITKRNGSGVHAYDTNLGANVVFSEHVDYASRIYFANSTILLRGGNLGIRT
jgi:hypothetical protein